MTAKAVPANATAAATDPAKFGWMVGCPPEPSKIVRKTDIVDGNMPAFFTFPYSRWAFANLRQLHGTAQVWRGDGPTSALPRAAKQLDAEIDAVEYTPLFTSDRKSWKQSLEENYTDAILVLHRGEIVYERYMGIMTPYKCHLAASCTKSFTGTIAACLVHEGKLDEKALVTKYVPELEGSAFADATVRDVMDMRIGVAYGEDYSDPQAGIWEALRACNFFPRPAGYSGALSTYAFLRKLKKQGEHGQDFHYKTVNTDVLGWIVRRACDNKSLSEILSERIWQPLGCEQDAAITIDEEGTEFAGGGLLPVLRDMARFGEMMRNNGNFNGRQIVPQQMVQDIRFNGSTEAFRLTGPNTIPGGAYRSQWWIVNNEHGAFSARGVHGQAIYVDPKAEMVVARFASHPVSTNKGIDPHSLPAYLEVGKYLLGRK